ncbi:MAG: hypothetical protein QM696_11145 [Steroidobacteraceae bacterium]
MLGQLLEFSLHAPDTGASFDHYRRLGFAAATAGDIWPHAYGVMCCGGLALGLHGVAARPLTLTFVQPDVARLHRELESMGIAASAVLGSDAFNQLELTDPAGTALRVLEARSFSAPADLPASTLLGTFRRLSLPAARPAGVEAFWRRLGMSGAWPLAWHRPEEHAGPVLLFRHPDPASAADRLEARGFELEERPLPMGAGGALQLRSPEDLLALALA